MLARRPLSARTSAAWLHAAEGSAGCSHGPLQSPSACIKVQPHSLARCLLTLRDLQMRVLCLTGFSANAGNMLQ